LWSKKKISVSKNGDLIFVNLRAYYEQNGQLKPTKKGITLSPEEFSALVGHTDAINSVLKANTTTTNSDEE